MRKIYPTGRLAIHANTNGVFYGERIVKEINKILKKEGDDQIELRVAEAKEFPNSMIHINIPKSVRGEDAFLVQWFPKPPTNDKLTSIRNKEEFFHTVSTLLQAGVKRLTMVTPNVYDQRKDTLEGRDTISAALFCQQLGGITHNQRMQGFCLDIHSKPVVGYYQMIGVDMVSIPVFKPFVDFIKEEHPALLKDSVIALPDAGASKRGRKFSELTGLPRLTVDKTRLSPTEVKVEYYAGKGISIEGKKALLVDDVLATGGTAGEAVSFLKDKGLKEAYWLMTHPEITDLGKLDDMHDKGLFKLIFTSDTIELPKRKYFVQVPTSKVMAQIIYNYHQDMSVGKFLE